MADEKSTKKKPYIILETDGTETDEHTLTDSEWHIVEALFENHPELITIVCPERDPELKPELKKEFVQPRLKDI